MKSHHLILTSTTKSRGTDLLYSVRCALGCWSGTMTAREARGKQDEHMQDIAGPEAQDARRSPLTGEPYPLCACGKIVYSDNLCYRCFQAQNAREQAS